MSKKGYWMVMLTVTDPEGYQRYRDAIGDTVSSFGGRYLVRGGQVTSPEGSEFGRQVVVEFDSYETALSCYRSPAYQTALQNRLAASTGHFAIVEGA
ncbi:DUF1330 domain-containing protein [Mesorhizobium sp. B2-5-13]|uniref:DUF1330 domain-containing protein n=1 Tax=unclassified Mesorhizobium TaxID=325217 RepID=UPI00112D9244|nr:MULTISPECIES: DUF1330 domain-containing protein [unclassified Mesorhizobium]TPJ35967.1 DUF1330 domain-containing protein [Mesorhizobium sp. B2-6-5]TPJ75781.1 DUF1330 domain-containing protein [Mesorhizobium sp. B2-5-13]TPK41500.1 DUF1330 domain-containing protein [Mesorhizobium sp. B2-5-5]